MDERRLTVTYDVFDYMRKSSNYQQKYLTFSK